MILQKPLFVCNLKSNRFPLRDWILFSNRLKHTRNTQNSFASPLTLIFASAQVCPSPNSGRGGLSGRCWGWDQC